MNLGHRHLPTQSNFMTSKQLMDLSRRWRVRRNMGQLSPNDPRTMVRTTLEGTPNLSNNRIIEESKNRKNEQSNASVSATDEHDICAPHIGVALATADSDRWNYVKLEPWALILKAAGCKIGPNNWTAWRALTDTWPVARVAEMAATVAATERFSDAVEEALKKSGGQSTAAAIARKTIKMDFTSHLQKTP